jgi:hypothetical protein
LGTKGFRFANLAFIVEHLPLKVRHTYYIIVYQANRSNSCAGKIQSNRRTKSSGTNYQDTRLGKAFLTFFANFRQDNLPFVTR